MSTIIVCYYTIIAMNQMNYFYIYSEYWNIRV